MEVDEVLVLTVSLPGLTKVKFSDSRQAWGWGGALLSFFQNLLHILRFPLGSFSSSHKSFQHFRVLPTPRLMDEEGASLLPLLQDCVNPPFVGPLSVHQGFAGEAGSTPKTCRQS